MNCHLKAAVSLTAGLALLPCGFASANEEVETIEVKGQEVDQLTSNVSKALATSGVDFSDAGGVSALPVINGLMGDRIEVLTDGTPTMAACGNQMNPPLSYVSANQLKSINVLPAVSPVSAGGDNIAGVIAVDTLIPQFTDSAEFGFSGGGLSYTRRGNSNGDVVGADFTGASDHWQFNYSGQYEKADSYKNGHGELVRDTLYKVQNHQVGGGFRDDAQQLLVKVSHQSISYQGFPNQYMDMTDNNSTGIVSKYQRSFDGGNVEAQVGWRGIKHTMGFFSPQKVGMMPMKTDAEDMAAKLKWQFPLANDDTLLLGQSFFLNKLDDWWPAVEGSMMMGPKDYVNINDGKRQRAALWAEWSQPVKPSWYYSAGIRTEYVSTNTGEVQSYNMMPMGGMPNMDYAASIVFNNSDRKQSDVLVDVTLLANNQLDDRQMLTLGLARKNRAPNLYERYSWGRGAMSTSMIGWFGDGNGYVGDINLAPETAHTASVSYSYDEQSWLFSANLWYTRVSDYIDVKVLRSFNRSNTEAGVRNVLQFVNVDATLKGLSLNGSIQLADNDYGKWTLSDTFKYQRGSRDSSGGDLYQIVPQQNRLRLTHQAGDWKNALEWQWIGKKDKVDLRRLENSTDSYSLLNLSSQYKWQQIRIELSVNNLLDKYYFEPLGGVNIADYRADPTVGFRQLEGRGRSVDVGVSYRF